MADPDVSGQDADGDLAEARELLQGDQLGAGHAETFHQMAGMQVDRPDYPPERGDHSVVEREIRVHAVILEIQTKIRVQIKKYVKLEHS
jgi:hypothetical protein